MATAVQNRAAPATGQDAASAAAPAFQITGTYQGLKAPAVNGVVALWNNKILCYSPVTNIAVQSPGPSLDAPLVTLCGDMTNGIAVYAGSRVAYLNGVGIAGASWYALPAPKWAAPAAASGAAETAATRGGQKAPTIKGMCGDLANGLIITDGSNLYSIIFNGQPLEWALLPAPPAGTIISIAGDPTNGILLVVAAQGGPSSLYFSGSGCSCGWVPLTATGTSLPTAKIKVSLATGNTANGFVVFGENQFYTYTVKYTAGAGATPATAVATPNKLTATPPFAITDLTGDATNGCTAVAAASGLIATSGPTLATWTVVNAAPPLPATATATATADPVAGPPDGDEQGDDLQQAA